MGRDIPENLDVFAVMDGGPITFFHSPQSEQDLAMKSNTTADDLKQLQLKGLPGSADHRAGLLPGLECPGR
jgi:hypothetical protein